MDHRSHRTTDHTDHGPQTTRTTDHMDHGPRTTDHTDHGPQTTRTTRTTDHKPQTTDTCQVLFLRWLRNMAAAVIVFLGVHTAVALMERYM